MPNWAGKFGLWALGVVGATLIFMGSVPMETARQNFQGWFETIASIRFPTIAVTWDLNWFQAIGTGMVVSVLANLAASLIAEAVRKWRRPNA